MQPLGNLADGIPGPLRKSDCDFVENLIYLLDWPITVDSIAAHLGYKDYTGVERRLERRGLWETDLAEAFRRRKPGYCPNCRLTQHSHKVECPDYLPTDDALRRRRIHARRRLAVAS